MAPQKVWNAAIKSASYKECHDIYKAYQQRKNGPKVIVVEENFWSPSHQLAFTVFAWHRAVMKIILGTSYRDPRFMKRWERCIKEYLSTTEIPKESTTNGFDCYPAPTIPQPLDVERCLRAYLKFLEHSPTELVYFDELRSLAQTDGVTLIRLRMPLPKEYRECLYSRSNKQKTWALIDQHCEGTPLIDLSELEIPANGWADGDHLNDLGAEVTTKALQAELEKMGLLQS